MNMDKDTQKKLISLVSESYGQIAKEYSDTRKKYHTPLFDALSAYAKEIKDGQNVLDVGCGSGRLISIFNDKKINYLGVDKSRELINYAKINYPGYRFEVGDLSELSQLAEINFDYVFCAAVIHHLPGKDLRIAALKQLKNKIS
jgi:2-polyprenyl-3-methyl-5-hydroxy-6-metoxy-1,4-benzoquinol methylase